MIGKWFQYAPDAQAVVVNEEINDLILPNFAGRVIYDLIVYYDDGSEGHYRKDYDDIKDMEPISKSMVSDSRLKEAEQHLRQTLENKIDKLNS